MPGRCGRRCHCWPRCLVLAIGIATLAEHALGVDLRIDQLLVSRRRARSTSGTAGAADRAGASRCWAARCCSSISAPPPGCVRRSGSRWRPAFTALTALLGFIFGAELRHRVTRVPLIGTALPTAVALLLISVGALAPTSDGGGDARGDLAGSGRAAISPLRASGDPDSDRRRCRRHVPVAGRRQRGACGGGGGAGGRDDGRGPVRPGRRPPCPSTARTRSSNPAARGRGRWSSRRPTACSSPTSRAGTPTSTAPAAGCSATRARRSSRGRSPT